ncbi:MAG: elongation factor G [Longimicrobiales bacterium]
MSAAAKEYRTEHIRNVVVLGHGGSGKTALIDALCWVGGTAKRHGRVADGTSVTMHTPEEIEHGISMQVTPTYTEWMDCKINLLDTPGYLDFTGEAIAATRVADGAVIVLGATHGVEVGTEKVWEYCESRGIPRFFFVSMMDKDHADFDKVYEEIKSTLTDKVIPVEIPIGAGENFRGIINLFSGRAHMYQAGAQLGEYDETEVPAEKQEKFNRWRTELLESIAATDDTLLEKYLEGAEIERGQALTAMKAAMQRGEMFPLFCGAPERAWGTRALLSKLCELVPNPAEARGEEAQRPGIDQSVRLEAKDNAPVAALVFKTSSEPHVGELSFFRIFSGALANGETLQNAARESSEKLAHLSVPLGKERLEVSRLHAGDIGVVAKLRDTHTNDTLSASDRPLVLAGIPFPAPDIAMAVHGVSRTDEDKIGVGLHKLHEEDPTFQSEYDGELKQTIIRGLGELHLDVQLERLRRKFGVTAETEQPRIAYRETIRRTAEAHGRHRKQSGGHGQFGDCWVRIKPQPRGSGYAFVDAISGGVIPGKFVPSVDKGIQEAAGKGVLAGYPVVDFVAECYDGSYHSVDSSDIAFQIAGSIAFQAAAEKAGVVLLEPIIEVEVFTPDEYMGDVIGDLNQRRGKILGMMPDGRKTRINALVPQAELYKYATTLRSLTQGRATHSRKFHGYEEVPAHAAQKIVSEQQESKKERQFAHA